MLIGDVKDPNRDPQVQNLISELARTHVSRYPIEVRSDGRSSVKFYDSRKVLKENPTLARLAHTQSDKGVWGFMLEAHNISNNKYGTHNASHKTRTTTDPSAMRKWLKQYIQPYSPTHIVELSFRPMRDAVSAWKEEFHAAVRNVEWHISKEAIVEDFINFKRTGVSPYSHPKLTALLTDEFVLQHEEDRLRAGVSCPTRHLFINPDGVVFNHTSKASRYSDLEDITYVGAHPSMETGSPEHAQKCSILKLVDDGKFVPNVGVRLSSNNFWVYE